MIEKLFHFLQITCPDTNPNFLGFIDTSIAPPFLYYSYIPISIFTLLVSFIFLRRKKGVATIALGLMGIMFAGRIFSVVFAWVGAPVALVHFSWQALYLFEALFYVFAVYLSCVFYFGKDVALRYKKMVIALLAPVFILAPTSLFMRYFDYTSCEAVPGPLVYYIMLLEGIAVIFAGYLAFASLKKKFFIEQKSEREAKIINIAVFILLIFFALFSLWGEFSDNWHYEMFSMIGVFIFFGFIGYSVARYRTFNMQVAFAELLVGAMGFLIFSLLFLRKISSVKIVVVITLFLFMVIAWALFKSIHKEQTTRRKGEQLARYLANANARLRELDKQKTEFVSVASHQLRSPIAAIKGYTSMIVEGSFGDVPDTLREPLSRILESGKRIALMVDDFLNVTRIEQGRMTYAMEKHNICDLIHEAIEELRVIGEKKGLAFNLGCKDFENTPVFIRADSGKLKQVFSNIVDNAIKYTPAGSISVGIEVLPEHHAVLVRVKDTGIGIPPQDQDRLFHKFNRASNANTATVYGTGLGLYIAKEIVRAHNGWIHIHSDGEGKGTTFTIELPLWREGVVPEVKENDEE